MQLNNCIINLERDGERDGERDTGRERGEVKGKGESIVLVNHIGRFARLSGACVMANACRHNKPLGQF